MCMTSAYQENVGVNLSGRKLEKIIKFKWSQILILRHIKYRPKKTL